MKKYLFFFLFFASISSSSQELLMDTEDVHPSDVIEPKFNGGGLGKFHEFVNQGLDLSKITKSGKIVVSFTINTVGEIKNIRILEFPDMESATEIIRVIQKAPKWEPAKRGGKPFSVDIKLPFSFTINSVQAKDTNNETENLNLIEKKPDFVGGMKRFYEFIANNYKTPDVEGLKGKVYLTFIVEVDGTISDIKVLKDIGYGTGAEAIRVLKKSPKWQPGEQDGKKVRCIYHLPITIQSR